MVAIVNTFTYTGTVNDATIPAGTTSIDIYLWGGAGGGGGNDRHAGGSGTAGHFVKKSALRGSFFVKTLPCRGNFFTIFGTGA